MKSNLMKNFLFLILLSFGIICSIHCLSVNQQNFAQANEIIEEVDYNQPQSTEKEALSSPTTVFITSISPINRVYDGTNIIDLEFTIDLTVDGLSVIGKGTTQTANVDNGKIVTVDISSLQLIGENAEDYSLSTILPTEALSVDITKRLVTFNWGVVGNQTTFDYTGNSLTNKISPFYLDINNVTHLLSFSISGYSFTGSAYSPNEFFRPGNYIATMITESQNYLLTDSTGQTTKSFSILRIDPTFTFSKTSFTYTGQVQNLADYVVVNNQEQTIIFSSQTTTFTTYSEAESLIGITIFVAQSQNYNSKSQVYNFTMSKAESSVNWSSLPISSIYNGQVQTINKSLITVNNTEQEVSVIVNDGKTLLNAGSYRITIQTIESSNYTAYIYDDFNFEILKKQIYVSQFSWQNTTSFTYERNTIHSVGLDISNEEIAPVYGGVYYATNAGTYTAKVSSYILTDSENTEIVGTTSGLIWTINRRVQSIPTLTSQSSFVYNGSEQRIIFNVMSNIYLSVSNYSATNAGNYEAKISLNDNNSIWNNWTIDTICVSWSIEKAVVAIPEITQNLFYTGGIQAIPIEESEHFDVINATATAVGEYTSYLVLIDPDNYTFEDEQNSYLTINWQILEVESHEKFSFFAIFFGVGLMIFGGLALTLQFTIKKRKRKKRHAEILNAQVLDKLKNKK
ncbi:MAG: hypothetical protein EOM55_01930 [Clostridia bacterium]|nr:hypothetical protein [Clostridia bacterium]